MCLKCINKYYNLQVLQVSEQQLLKKKNNKMDKRLLNVSLLGLSFMFVFTAFQTMGNIEVNKTKNKNYFRN